MPDLPDSASPESSGSEHGSQAAGADPSQAGSSGERRQGWPLGLRLVLAALLLGFVWSPFLAMLARLSQVNPALQPTGGVPVLTAPGGEPEPVQPAPRPARP